MDALSAAAPLARVFLALEDAEHDGDVWLRQRARQVRVSLVRGRIAAIAGVESAPLGDLLRESGDAPAYAHDVSSMGRARIGARLIAAGQVSPEAVRGALARQLVRRLDALLCGPTFHVKLATDAPSSQHEMPNVPRLATSVTTTSAVWAALFLRAVELPHARLAALAGDQELTLSVRGARRLARLEQAVQASELREALLSLRSHAPARASTHELTRSPRALGELAELLASACTVGRARLFAPTASVRVPWAWQLLRACLQVLRAVAPPGDGYVLLMRKRRELARAASARALLDLPAAAGPEAARSALRRLARTLHPDRFACDDAHVRALAEDTLRALVAAERALRSTT